MSKVINHRVSGKEGGGREMEGERKREGGTEKMCVYA